ncbi:MAG: EAL domain-containing protein, partial [Planctomycetes bacterium]|nr:EAL domain-containing protein [Planctomycetota bacterium]
AIVQGIIELSHTLGLEVAAEGVEDQVSLDLLGAFGCDVVQGYHLGRPMPAQRYTEWRGDWESRPRGSIAGKTSRGRPA